MQQEILAPTPLLNSDGTLSQPGWARQPHWQYQRQAIRAPRWRIKEWDYYAVLCADQQLGITLTVADLGYAGLFALCFLDFANRSFTQVDSLTLLPLGKLGLSADNHQGRIRHQSAALSIDIDLQPGRRHLRFAAPGLTCADGRRGLAGEILLQQPATLESMNIATSWAENRRAFYYNSKINCMPASGGFSLGGQQHSFDPQRDSGVLDWGRGVWTYTNTWYWASASGLVAGEAFGLNFGYGFSDRSPASENVLVYRGNIHKLDQLQFHFDRHDWLKPWRISSNDGRVDLAFIPLLDRNSHLNALLMVSEQHQVFGHYQGRVILDDGEVLHIDALLGFAEEVRNRW